MRDNMKRILILGAGTAGSIVANKLARELRVEIAKDEVDIRILDKDRTAINMAGLTLGI
jgi:sulfide:quinone oxidoreductase